MCWVFLNTQVEFAFLPIISFPFLPFTVASPYSEEDFPVDQCALTCICLPLIALLLPYNFLLGVLRRRHQRRRNTGVPGSSSPDRTTLGKGNTNVSVCDMLRSFLFRSSPSSLPSLRYVMSFSASSIAADDISLDGRPLLLFLCG